MATARSFTALSTTAFFAKITGDWRLGASRMTDVCHRAKAQLRRMEGADSLLNFLWRRVGLLKSAVDGGPVLARVWTRCPRLAGFVFGGWCAGRVRKRDNGPLRREPCAAIHGLLFLRTGFLKREHCANSLREEGCAGCPHFKGERLVLLVCISIYLLFKRSIRNGEQGWLTGAISPM